MVQQSHIQPDNFFLKRTMDYRTWMNQRKYDEPDEAFGSKFEVTRKTNSTILEESSKAEEEDESILVNNKPKHRSTNSKTINPMLLMTNTDKTMRTKSGLKDYVEQNSNNSNTFSKEQPKHQHNNIYSPRVLQNGMHFSIM